MSLHRSISLCLFSLLTGCQSAFVKPPDGKTVNSIGNDVYRKQLEAIYGAGYANSLQPPSAATETVSSELGLAGPVVISETRRKVVQERVDAGISGDKDKYARMAGDHIRETQELKDLLTKAKSDLAAAEAAGLQKAKDARQSELFRWFGIVGAGMTLLGGLAAAVGAWAGRSIIPGVILLAIGLAVGSFIFVWGTPVFWALVSIVGLGLISAAGFYIWDALKHRRLLMELELNKSTLSKVVRVVEDQNIPKTDPLKVALNGELDKANKDVIEAIVSKLP